MSGTNLTKTRNRRGQEEGRRRRSSSTTTPIGPHTKKQKGASQPKTTVAPALGPADSPSTTTTEKEPAVDSPTNTSNNMERESDNHSTNEKETQKSNNDPTTPDNSSPGLTNKELANALMPPTSEKPNKITPSSTVMKAVVDLNSDSPDYCSILKNHVQCSLWSVVKFVDYDTKQGKMVKHFVKTKLKMSDQNFENRWAAKDGIRKDVTDILRHQRAYVTQQLKSEYFRK